MSLRNLTSQNDNKIFCGDFECNNMTCKNMVMPTGADLDAHNISVDNDLLVKTQDGLNTIKFNTPTIGQAGYQLTVDVNGNTYWGSSGGVGGVDNPMSNILDANNFNIINLPEIKTTSTPLKLIGNPIQLESAVGDIQIYNNLDLKLNDIRNVDELKLNTISAYDGKIITAGHSMSFNNNNIFSVGNIQTQSVSSQGGEVKYSNKINMNNNNIENVGTILTNGVLTLQGQNISINSNSSIIDMNNGKLYNVDNIFGFVKYKIITVGSDVGFNGRILIEAQTISLTPVLLFRRIYTNGCSIYDGSFMSYNPTQNKIWRAPASCVVDVLNIDKQIGGYGIASIGGTTRAATIDFNINAGYLECWITANFTDLTTSVFECSIWSDTII